MDDDRYSLTLIEALSRVWMRIRFLHPEVPPVVLLAAPAQRGERSVLGHFAALRWQGKKEGDAHLHEVVVIAEHLNRPPDKIVETLLHEGAHAMNFARGVHDCSASQYHNKRFEAAAMELGLEVSKVRFYGYARTRLLPNTLQRYADEVMYLERVLIHRKGRHTNGTRPPGGAGGDADGGEEETEKKESRLRKATCGCDPPFIIRLSLKTFMATTIRCESCGEPFRLA